MRLQSLHLVNVCQHRDLTVGLHPGLTAITGRNGAGKSSIINAIQSAITNDFSIFPGVKSDNISQLAPEDEPSRIVLRMTHGDREIEVQRGLRGARSVLLVDGEAPVVGDTKITGELFRILGLSPAVLSEVVFIGQTRMYNFLAGSQAARAEVFQSLFGGAAADRVYGLLSKELAACPVVQVSAEDGLLEAQIEEARTRLAAIRAELAGLVVDPAARTDAEAVLKAEAAYRAEAQRAATATARLQGHEAELLSLEAGLVAASAERETFEAACAAMADTVAAAKRDIEAWAEYRRSEQTRRAIASQQEQLRREEGMTVAPVTLADNVRALAEAYAQEGPSLQADLQAIARLEAAAKRGDPCPTCGTPAVDLRARRDSAAGERAAIQSRLDSLKAAGGALADYLSRERAYLHAVESLSRRRLQLELTAASLQLVDPPGRPEEACRAELAEAAEFRRLGDAADARCRDLGSRRDLLSRLVAQARAEAAITAVPVDPADVDRARGVLDGLRKAEVLRGQLGGQAAELEAAIGRDSARLVRLRAEAAEGLVRNGWRDHLESLRAVVHRDRLPRMVSQSYLVEIEDEINGMLEEFDIRFLVETQEDLSFVARFSDGRRQPAARLSYGEKVLLALAFRVAVNSIFSKDLGTLVLDEPTDSVDEVNLGCLELAIGRLREAVGSRGLQTIIVTHERRLARLADATIDLGGW